MPNQNGQPSPINLYNNALEQINLYRQTLDKNRLRRALSLLRQTLALLNTNCPPTFAAKIYFCLAKIYSNGIGHHNDPQMNVAFSKTILKSIQKHNPIGYNLLDPRIRLIISQQLTRPH